MKEEDLIILKALFGGSHLEKSELKRASDLIYWLDLGLKQRGFNKILEFNNDQQEFKIPHMTLCRRDIKKSLRDKFSNNEMQLLANKMSDIFMNDWASNLHYLLKEYTEGV